MSDKPKAGRYCEVNLDTIAGGELKTAIEQGLKKMAKDLDTHERKTDTLDGKIKLNISVTLQRSKQNPEEYFELDFETGVTQPKEKRSKFVRGGNGKILADMDDIEDLNGTKQLKLPTYDRFGRHQAIVNTETGEPISQDEPAAKIG